MSFDRLAPHYRWMETVLAGNTLHRCRTRWLPEVKTARRILLAGEGHGRMLAECAQTIPEAEILVLDYSPAMLAVVERRWQETGNTSAKVAFQQADLRDWHHPGTSFDLVVTNFFLDCFAPDELPRVVANLADAAAPDARWLLADFTLPPSGWRRTRARAVLGLAYGFFRVATDISARMVTAPDEALRRHGFIMQQRAQFNHGLLHADLWARTAP